MNDVFISYSRRDKIFTLKLFEALKVTHREIWADWEDIPPGSDWFAEIKEGVEQSRSVLFILSPEWIKSRECAKELEYAVKMGKRLIPVIWQDVAISDVPPELARINWIFMREGDDFKKGIQLLETTIDTDLEWLKIHTRLQTRALEWNNKNRDKSFILRGKDLQDAELQLATNSSKDPHPTDLQREYVFESRKVTDRQRKMITSISITGAIIMTALAAIALMQSNLATKRAKIARAGELASQVQLILSRNLQGSNTTSLLLALEAMNSISKLPYTDTIPAQQALYDAMLYVSGTPITGHTGPISNLVYSQDGRWLASTSKSDNIVLVWDTQSNSIASINASEHEGPIKTLAFSPDGQWLATGSEDQTVRLWNTHNLSDAPIILDGHAGSVNILAFSPDGNLLATGSDDATVRLWDIRSPTSDPIKILREYTNPIKALTFSPDGHWLAASGGDDFTIRIWDMKTPDFKSNALTGHTGTISKLIFSPDSNWLASGSWDETVRLWNLIVPTNDPIVLDGIDSQAITDLAFNPQGDWLAIATGGNTLRLWNILDPSTEAKQLNGHTSAISTLDFNADGTRLATGSIDKTVVVWNMEDPNKIIPILNLYGHDSTINTLDFSPDGHWLASGSDDKTVRLWDIQNPSVNPASLPGSNDVIFSVAFSSDSQWLATGGATGETRLWNVHDHSSTVLPNSHTGAIASLAFSPDDKWIATGSYNDKSILIWKANNPLAIPLERIATDAVYAIAFSEDGKQMITANADNTVELWDMDDSSSMPTVLIQNETESTSIMAISQNGKWFASDNSVDHKVNLWNIQNGTSAPRTIKEADGRITALAFDHHDHWLAISSDFKSDDGITRKAIYLWNLQDPSLEPIILLGHEDRILALTFSWDDRFLISGSDDYTSRVWDMENIASQKIPLRLNDSGRISTLAISPDGKTLATATIDKTIHLWDMDTHTLSDSACKVVGRNMTLDEWKQFGFTEPYRTTCP